MQVGKSGVPFEIKPIVKPEPVDFSKNMKTNWFAPLPWHKKLLRGLKAILPKKKYLTIEEFDKQENIKEFDAKTEKAD